MFNDLNQTGQPTPNAPVDDIFADTDKTVEAKKFSGYYSDPTAAAVTNPTDVETQKTGLSSSENASTTSKGKILKIGLIILLIILLLGLGYLVYAKFLAGKTTDPNLVENPVIVTNEVPTTTTTTTNPQFGQDLTSTTTPTSTPVSEEIVPVPSVPLATTTPPVITLIDSDSDGLSDEEETVLGTNLNLKDSDGDDLSDYEEIQIYKTNPLKADTDNDGHNDGEEVKNGYNPLGTGKMTDVAPSSPVAPITPGL